jgi:hypothetical protein
MSYIQQFFTSRDNNANSETFVGQVGRLWWDPVTNQIYSSDGNTPGGVPLSGGGGNGTPGGSNSQVQFNQAGSFGGSAFLTFNVVTGTLTTVAVSAIGNITSNYFIGNGSLLTGLPATYSNADVATYLASGTDTLDIITTANVSGNYILGNGALLTGVATSVANINNGNSNVTVVSSGGNVAVGVGGTGNVAVFAASGEYITGVLSASGNVAGAYFIGNGSALTSITGANITGTVANATYAVSAGSAGTVTANAQPNITSVGILTSLSSSGNVTAGNILTTGIVSVVGNVTGNYFVGNANVQFTSSTAPPATGNLIGAQWYSTATDTLYEYQSDGVTLYWVDITGPVIGSNGAVAGSAIINGTSNVTVTANANTTVGVAGTTILTVASTGEYVTGVVSATGNITGSYFIGNGSQLTGIASSSYSNSNVATFLADFGSNVISTTGNITSNYFLGNGSQLTGLPATYGNANVATLLAAFGSNTIVTTSNITGGNILGGANVNATTHTGTTASLSGNVTGGNVLSNGQLSAAGNITGARLALGGDITTPGNIGASYINGAYYTGTWSTNFVALGNVSATGNVISTGAVYSNYNTNTANTGSFMAQGGNTKGGTGYLDFLVVQNTSGGATNPYKWLRVNSTGGLEIINSAYTSTVFSLTDSGNVNVSGQYQVSGKQAVNGPAFRAYIDGSQTISSGSQQKVTFGSETFDTNANFASSRFTPTVEGYYQLNATVRISGSSGTGEIMLTIWKNGSEYARGTNEQGTEQGNNFYSMQVSDLAYANGSTDYFEIYIQQTTGGNRDTTAGTNISYFSGAMVRGA